MSNIGKILFSSLILLLVACQSSRNRPDRPSLLWIGSGRDHTPPLWNIDNSRLCADLTDTQACAQRIEAHYIALYPQQCVRSGDRLTIHLRSGQQLHYEDAEAADPAHAYRYNLLAYFPDHQLYLVRKQVLSGQWIMLVDAFNGEEIEIANSPFFSPDKTRFAAATNLKQQTNWIEVWTIEPIDLAAIDTATSPTGRIVREWAGESDTWRFSGIEWIDASSFSLTRKRSADAKDIIGVTMRLVRVDKGWVGHIMGATD